MIGKIEKLIALSASPSKEEARTAAMQACRLIREHGIVLQEPTKKKVVVTAQKAAVQIPPESLLRAEYELDTESLSRADFLVTVSMAYRLLSGDEKARYYFSSQELKGATGSKQATVRLGILREITAREARR